MASRRSGTSASANHVTEGTVTESWNGKSFQLPKSLPAGASPAEKLHYFTKTLQGLDAASDAPVLTKLNLLESRFNFANLMTEIDASLTVMLDTTAGFENPPIILTPQTIFDLSEPTIRNQAAAELQIPQANVDQLPAVFRRTATYCTFQLKVNTRAAYSGSPNIATRSQLLSETFTATVRLPRYQPIEGEFDHGFTILHPLLTSEILRNPDNTLQTIINITGEHPVIGTLRKNSGDVAASHDHDAFRVSYMKLFNKTRYSLYRTLLKQEYLSDAIVPLASLTLELNKVKQLRYDEATHRNVYLSVEEYYNSFNAALSMFGNGKPYPIDVANTFWVGLLTSIRNTAASENYNIPVAIEPATIQNATQRLREVKEAAVGFEKKVNQLDDAVTRVTGRSNAGNRTGTRAFFSVPPSGFDNGGDSEHLTEAYSTAPSYASIGTADPPPIQDPATMSDDAVWLAASVYTSAFLSSAELALQTATGSAFPPLECWGCKGHPQRHDDRFHRWSSCPYRGDRVAQDNAKKGFQQFIQDRQKRQEAGPQRSWGNPYAPNASTATASFASTNWKEEGFPSKHAAELVCQIADPSTYVSARKLCFQALSKQVSWNDSGASRKTPRNDETTTPGSVKGFLHLHFIPSSPVPVMATQFGSRVHLSISQQMPHVRFPVGDSNAATIYAMVDTCAGLNLGRLQYHYSIFMTSPHLVESYILIKDVDYLEEFDIGGVDEHGNATRVTAVITYKTPFRISGQAVLLSFGLSESASTNTILGLPFLRATRSAMIMTGDDEEVLICQRLGTTFRVEYQVPLRGNQAPISSKDTHSAFPYHVDTPTGVTDELQRLLSTVTLAAPRNTEETIPEDEDNTWTINFDLPNIE